MLREQLPSEPAPVVLIVEDDVLLRLTIAGSLRDAGFEVLEAANAAEAVQILKCIPVDALFSDIDMPGRMDGCALAQWVHQRELNVRIILTSGPDRPVRLNVLGDLAAASWRPVRLTPKSCFSVAVKSPTGTSAR